MIDWNSVSGEDVRTIHEITKRAMELAKEYDAGRSPRIDAQTLSMDITAAHISCPLKLRELLVVDDSNFGHDVFGIHRHINRETGELENCFLPRLSA